MCVTGSSPPRDNHMYEMLIAANARLINAMRLDLRSPVNSREQRPDEKGEKTLSSDEAPRDCPNQAAREGKWEVQGG